MPDNIELFLRVRADIDNAVNGLDRLEKEIAQGGRAAEGATKSTGAMAGGLDTLTRAAIAYISVTRGLALLRQADDFNVLQARIRAATAATGDYNRVSRDLLDITQNTGTALEQTVSLFQSLSRSRTELRATTGDILQVTRAVEQLGVISGSGGGGLAAGLLQLSQGLASGTLRAEEFNSILENLPELANRIALGLGKSVGELRAAVLSGNILSKDVFGAILTQVPQITKDFEAMGGSLARSSERFGTAFSVFLDQLNQSSGATDLISNALDHWAEVLQNALVPGLEAQKERLTEIEHHLVVLNDLQDRRSFLSGTRDHKIKALEREAAGLRLLIELGKTRSRQQSDQEKNVKERAALEQDLLDKQKVSARFDAQAAAATSRVWREAIAQMERAKVARLDLNKAFAATREDLLKGPAKRPEDSNLLDVAQQISKARQALTAGDFEQAVTGARQAKDTIEAMARAGGESRLVLLGVLEQARRVADAAGQGLQDQEQGVADIARQQLQGLIEQSKELQKIPVEVETDKAKGQFEALKQELARSAAEGLRIPVTLAPQGSGNVGADLADAAQRSGARP